MDPTVDVDDHDGGGEKSCVSVVLLREVLACVRACVRTCVRVDYCSGAW